MAGCSGGAWPGSHVAGELLLHETGELGAFIRPWRGFHPVTALEIEFSCTLRPSAAPYPSSFWPSPR